ncbi:hypothetical protein ABZS81_11580 [Streptomyces sp. NPDC005318]|uniref:hypothetical protein n=1 Tax=Streptomyces sp. NPDC005318 TaxID=3157031 RepID=UPI0033A1C75B
MGTVSWAVLPVAPICSHGPCEAVQPAGTVTDSVALSVRGKPGPSAHAKCAEEGAVSALPLAGTVPEVVVSGVVPLSNPLLLTTDATNGGGDHRFEQVTLTSLYCGRGTVFVADMSGEGTDRRGI